MARIADNGHPVDTSGELPSPGDRAPDFRLVASDLSDVSLATWSGKRKILSIVPSLDTEVCARSARRFNERAASLRDTMLLVISADLPLSQQRFCTTAGLDHVVPLSMMRGRKFAKDYGVLLVNGPLEGICARAVVVLDEHDVVLHSELVPDIASEPDYEAALAALGR